MRLVRVFLRRTLCVVWAAGDVFLAAMPVWALSVPVGTLPPGFSVTIEVDVQVVDPVNPVDLTGEVCSQGQVTGTNFTPVATDDPDLGGVNDVTCTSLPELGDAPTPYPTLIADNGAVHAMGGGVYLGFSYDADSDGQPDSSANGDDIDGNDDDDGVVFTSEVIPGATATVDVQASTPCLLNAWFDFNLNGVWTDPGEQIFTDLALTAGVNAGLTFAVPAGAQMGGTYTRFRCSNQGGLNPTGLAPDGEVEDYQIVTVPVELQSFQIE